MAETWHLLIDLAVFAFCCCHSRLQSWIVAICPVPGAFAADKLQFCCYSFGQFVSLGEEI